MSDAFLNVSCRNESGFTVSYLGLFEAKRLHRREKKEGFGARGLCRISNHVSLWCSAPHACAFFSEKASDNNLKVTDLGPHQAGERQCVDISNSRMMQYRVEGSGRDAIPYGLVSPGSTSIYEGAEFPKGHEGRRTQTQDSEYSYLESTLIMSVNVLVPRSKFSDWCPVCLSINCRNLFATLCGYMGKLAVFQMISG